MILLALVTVFLGVFTLAAVAVVAGAQVLARRQAGQPGAAEPEASGLFREEALSSISLWQDLLARFDFVEVLKTRMLQADLNWTVGRITSMMLLIFAVTLVVLSSLAWLPMLLAFAVSVAAAWTPYAYVLRRRRQRFEAFEEQFPDALDFLARSLRAGHPFAVSLEMLASDDAPPLSAEMRVTSDERRLGRSWEEALGGLSRRVPLLNVRLFTAAILLQSRTGGRLSEVLGQLAETMREANSLRGEVRALAAHGRVTGTVLTFLPVGIAVMMMIVNPGFLRILIDHPTGRILIVAALLCLVAAHFIIRRIVSIRP